MAPTSDVIPKLDRFAGCLIGQAVADALGAPFEGLTAETIWRDFGHPQFLFTASSEDTLYYTDDTQMMISVAEELCEGGPIDSARLMGRFIANYEPQRCYGPGMQKILDAATLGEDWQSLVKNQFPGGSFGNGAAMRVAPIGLLFSKDPERLLVQARTSAFITHQHPLGMDGARVFALAVAMAMASESFNAREFFLALAMAAETEEFQWQLRTAGDSDDSSSLSFGSSLPAHRSVTSALQCFARSPDSYASAVSSAIALGDDTDTLAGMTGALIGARLGIDGIPKSLIDRLENGKKGRDYLLSVARTLASINIE